MTQHCQTMSTHVFSDLLRPACDALVDGITDVIEVYNDSLDHTGFGLIAKTKGDYTIRGVKKADGKYPLAVSIGVNDSNADRLTYGKAIMNFEGPTCRFANMTLRGAQVSDANGGNGAGVRINPGVVAFYGNNFKCVDNQNGILTNTPTGDIVLEDVVLDHNGYGRQGYTHNIYAGDANTLTMRRCTVTNSQFGHDLKSRARTTKLYQVHCEGSDNGRELDLSNGGILYAENCNFIKHDNAAQNNLIHLAPEGVTGGRPEKYEFVNCLFQIDIPNQGRGLQLINNGGGVECVLTDPLFKVGGATLSDAEAAPFLIGNVRIVQTGGQKGPKLPVGCFSDIVTPGATTASPSPDVAPVPAATPPAPAPAAPAPTPTNPAPTPAPTSPLQAPVVSGGWTKVGMEGDRYSGKAGQQLRYGANGAFVTRVLAADETFVISNAYFGSDPTPGVVKEMDVMGGAGVAPTAPAPMPAPAPAPVAAPVPMPAPAPAAAPAGTIDQGNFNAAVIAGMIAELSALGYTVTKK